MQLYILSLAAAVSILATQSLAAPVNAIKKRDVVNNCLSQDLDPSSDEMG